MSRFCLALAAGALLAASPVAAQSPVTYSTTSAPLVTTTPAYSGSSTVVMSDDAATPRRGLFARIRANRAARSTAGTAVGPVYSSPAYSSPIYGAPAMTSTPGTVVTPTPTTTPMPATTTPVVPMQMPGRMSMNMPAGMQSVVVDGMVYQVPATLPPEGVVISERLVTPMTGTTGTDMPNLTFRYTGPNVVMPASGVMPTTGTVITAGGPVQVSPRGWTVTPATYSVPVTRPMPRR